MRFSVAVHPLGNSRQPGGRGIETRGRIGMQKKRQTGGGEGRERGLVRSISLSAGRLPPFRDCRLLLRPGGTPVVGGNARRETAALGKRSLADITTPPTSTPPPLPIPRQQSPRQHACATATKYRRLSVRSKLALGEEEKCGVCAGGCMDERERGEGRMTPLWSFFAKH